MTTPDELSDGQKETWGYYDGALYGVLRRDGKLYYFDCREDDDWTQGDLRVYELRELGPVAGTITEAELCSSFEEVRWSAEAGRDE